MSTGFSANGFVLGKLTSWQQAKDAGVLELSERAEVNGKPFNSAVVIARGYAARFSNVSIGDQVLAWNLTLGDPTKHDRPLARSWVTVHGAEVLISDAVHVVASFLRAGEDATDTVRQMAEASIKALASNTAFAILREGREGKENGGDGKDQTVVLARVADWDIACARGVAKFVNPAQAPVGKYTFDQARIRFQGNRGPKNRTIDGQTTVLGWDLRLEEDQPVLREWVPVSGGSNLALTMARVVAMYLKYGEGASPYLKAMYAVAAPALAAGQVYATKTPPPRKEKPREKREPRGEAKVVEAPMAPPPPEKVVSVELPFATDGLPDNVIAAAKAAFGKESTPAKGKQAALKVIDEAGWKKGLRAKKWMAKK